MMRYLAAALCAITMCACATLETSSGSTGGEFDAGADAATDAPPPMGFPCSSVEECPAPGSGNPCDVAACIAGLCAVGDAPDGTTCGGANVCSGGVCDPATCTAQACPADPLTVCPNLGKGYCCNGSAYTAVCEVKDGLVSNTCPIDCPAPCATAADGTITCGIALP